MLNREELAQYPDGEWTLHHASSYDRRSISKYQKGWYANDDWDNYVRKDTNQGRIECVLLDADGPGVVTRFWVGGHPHAKAFLRFYIDGKSIPFWEADHTAALIGQNQSIGFPLSVCSVEGPDAGDNLYAPIPFSHHLKITYEVPKGNADTRLWYNIDYRVYRPNVSVKSFSAKTPQKDKEILKKTNSALKEFMIQSPEKATVPDEKKEKSISFVLGPGASKSIKVTGLGSVKRLLVHLKTDSLDNAVKNLWLQASFDGEETVNVPVGFFFGCGDQLVEAKSWYDKVDTRGYLASYWVMPYRHEVVIRLVNKSHLKVSGSLTVASGSWKWNSRSMYFHANFQKLDNYMTRAQQGQDYDRLSLTGKSGVYVGDILQVTKEVGGWWGEGDEKIYVDDTTFPADFGTGTEDYYGYSWGSPKVFNHAFFSQPVGNANLQNKGGVTVDSRFRDLDAIPFRHLFHFDMESWTWFTAPVDYAWSCFWYEKPDSD